MIYKKLDKLQPAFREKVELFLKDNPEIFVTETWRDEERQKQLIEKGASKIRRSLHQDGLAIDIAFSGKELYPKDIEKWRKVANSAKKYGIDWPFSSWDKPHFQDNGKELEIVKIPDWAQPTVDKMKAKGIKTSPTEKVGEMPLYQLLMILDKYNDNN